MKEKTRLLGTLKTKLCDNIFQTTSPFSRVWSFTTITELFYNIVPYGLKYVEISSNIAF